MRKNVITLFVGILLLGIPMVYAGKPVICIFVLDNLTWPDEENFLRR